MTPDLVHLLAKQGEQSVYRHVAPRRGAWLIREIFMFAPGRRLRLQVFSRSLDMPRGWMLAAQGRWYWRCCCCRRGESRCKSLVSTALCVVL